MRLSVIFVFINLITYFGCSVTPSQWDGSFEYPHHMFWVHEMFRLNETVLLSTHSICFCLGTRKMIPHCTILFGGLIIVLNHFFFVSYKSDMA